MQARTPQSRHGCFDKGVDGSGAGRVGLEGVKEVGGICSNFSGLPLQKCGHAEHWENKVSD